MELVGVSPVRSEMPRMGSYTIISLVCHCTSSRPARRTKWVTQAASKSLVLVGCWFLWAEGIVFSIAVAFLSFWLACVTPMMVGMWVHLNLLKIAAEKNPKPLICMGDKLENVLSLQPAATETWRKVHHLCYFLLERKMVWGTQDMLLNICPITV